MINTLPHRFREKSCRRYESTIAAALASYPMPTKIMHQAGGLSLCTISNRLRDAIKSWQQNRWLTSKFLLDDLIKYGPDIVVSEQKDCVVISFRTTDKIGPVVEAAPPGVYRVAVEPSLTHHVIPDEDLMATIKLAEDGMLNSPAFVRLTESKAEELELAHNIALVRQPDGLYKLT